MALLLDCLIIFLVNWPDKTRFFYHRQCEGKTQFLNIRSQPLYVVLDFVLTG